MHQNPGINDDVLHWMWLSAINTVPPITIEGRYGGIILDECNIQEDVAMNVRSDGIKLNGFVNLGIESAIIDKLLGIKEPVVANHVLQIVFLGHTGFRFPIAHYPTSQARAVDLYTCIWDAVDKLLAWDFHVEYVCMDGAIQNRQLMQMHFSNIDPASVNYSTTNLVNPSNKLYCSFDYSHVCKRIRNDILSSRIGCKRTLSLNGKTITWDMWENAYNWNNENVCHLHHRLTYEHINPSTTDKMRNHLAEEVLNDSMLNLFQSYKESLGENAKLS